LASFGSELCQDAPPKGGTPNYYVGQTDNLHHRLAEHNAGEAA